MSCAALCVCDFNKKWIYEFSIRTMKCGSLFINWLWLNAIYQSKRKKKDERLMVDWKGRKVHITIHLLLIFVVAVVIIVDKHVLLSCFIYVSHSILLRSHLESYYYYFLIVPFYKSYLICHIAFLHFILHSSTIYSLIFI